MRCRKGQAFLRPVCQASHRPVYVRFFVFYCYREPLSINKRFSFFSFFSSPPTTRLTSYFSTPFYVNLTSITTTTMADRWQPQPPRVPFSVNDLSHSLEFISDHKYRSIQARIQPSQECAESISQLNPTMQAASKSLLKCLIWYFV